MNCNTQESDEDVVIEGSEFHKILLQMGFKDFETVPVKPIKVEYSDNNLTQNNSMNQEKFLHKFYYLYNQITQDNQLYQDKIQTILLLEPLLDDHTYNIQAFISTEKPSLWKTIYEWLPIFGTSIATTTSFLFKQEKLLTSLLVSSLSLCIYNKYLKRFSIHNLRTLITLQNTFHKNIKKSLNILRNDYRIKKNVQSPGNKFIDFRKNHFKFLMPLLSALINSLEQMSLLYYGISKIFYKFLPASKFSEDLLTIFEPKSFLMKGEITYENLKSLYYTFLLTQSEMLHLLAVVYNEKINSRISIPEYKINYIINQMIKHIKKYNNVLCKIIIDYNACNIQFIQRKFRETNSKWQDIYMQLDVTSQKLQTSYLLISEIMNNIDNQNEDNINNEEIVKTLLDKMKETNKSIVSASSFLEVATLLLMRKWKMITKNDDFEIENEDVNINTLEPTVPKMIDFNPEIVDEVFEEYIKEEYLKPSHEESDEFMYDDKMKRLLSMNYMQELKEVLTGKYKFMLKRESKALERTYNKKAKDNDTDNENVSTNIPVPPPRPKINSNPEQTILDNNLTKHDKNIKPKPIPAARIKYLGTETTEDENETLRLNLSTKDIFLQKKTILTVNNIATEDREDVKMQLSSGACLPGKPSVSFLKNEEETFLGSGENSEEELISNSSDDNENL